MKIFYVVYEQLFLENRMQMIQNKTDSICCNCHNWFINFAFGFLSPKTYYQEYTFSLTRGYFYYHIWHKKEL